MAFQTTTRTAGASSHRALLACGMLVAPVFYGLAVLQLLLRPEFDLRALPISYLALGELGWIQVGSFILSGLFAILCAVGLKAWLKGQRGGTWGPILVGLFGVGTVMAGLFPPDPFPKAGETPTMSVPGALHMLAFFLAFLSLIAACFVFARRFFALKEGGWALYSMATGILVPVLIGLGMSNPASASVIVAGAGLVLFGWLGVLSWRMRSSGVVRPAA